MFGLALAKGDDMVALKLCEEFTVGSAAEFQQFRIEHKPAWSLQWGRIGF